MDTSQEYIKMCDTAVKQTDIGKIFNQLPSDIKLGTRICFRSFIGMITLREKERDESGIAGFIPETLALRNWTEKNQDLTRLKTGQDFNDEGFPLFRQDQLQEMVKNGYTNLIEPLMDLMLYFRVKKYPSVLSSYEQFWLAFVMSEKYKKIWHGKYWKKEKG